MICAFTAFALACQHFATKAATRTQNKVREAYVNGYHDGSRDSFESFSNWLVNPPTINMP